jgi:tetratricopeptide (TPR) repeat protein
VATFPRSHLVGRADELAQLRAGVASARQGEPGAVLIRGEAGVGKSRLVFEAVDRLSQPGDVLLVGHGVDVVGGELPFGVITSALRDLIRRTGLDAVRSAGTGGLAALNFLVPGLLDETSVQPDRLRIFDAVATMLARLSHHHLTWLVIEDLHWSDSSSRDLLNYLVRSLDTDVCLLTTCTLRTQDTSPHTSATLFADELARLPHALTIRLDHLDRAEVGDLLGELAGDVPTPAYLDRVLTLSNGIPFLVEELAAAEMDEHGPVPDSVATTMLRRIADLPPDTRRLVQAASLGGPHLQPHLLAKVCDMLDERLAAALDKALATNVLEIDDDGTGYRFHHALMRAAVEGSLSPANRTAWHRYWAEQLDEDTSGDRTLTTIAAAHHWAQTQDDARAFDAAYRAADLAEQLGAETERITLLTRLLDLWLRVSDAEQRAGRDRDTVLLDLLSAHGASGSSDDVKAALTLLDAELARSDPVDDPRRLWLRLERAFTLENLGSDTTERFFDPASTALGVLRDAPRDRMFVRAVEALAGRSPREAAEESVVDLLSEAVHVAENVGTPLEQLMIKRTQVMTVETVRGPEEALELSADLVRWARDRCSLAELSVTESNHAWTLVLIGRFHDAADFARRTLTRLSRPALSRWASTFVVENLVRALAEIGDWDAAEDHLLSALTLDVEGEHRVFIEVEAGLIRCHRGDFEGADAYLTSAQARLPEPEVSWLQAAFCVRWLAAEIAMAKKDHETARALLLPHLAPHGRQAPDPGLACAAPRRPGRGRRREHRVAPSPEELG